MSILSFAKRDLRLNYGDRDTQSTSYRELRRDHRRIVAVLNILFQLSEKSFVTIFKAYGDSGRTQNLGNTKTLSMVEFVGLCYKEGKHFFEHNVEA